MNRRQKIVLSVTGIFIVLLALVGLTYAYFLTKITGNTNDKSISVSTANLSVTYQDGDNEIVTVEKVVPDIVVAEKVFYVKNTGTAPTTYSIILDNIENNFERNQDLVYTLTKEGETEPSASGNIASGSHQIIIPKVDIALNGTDTYTFKLEYVEAGVDQSKDMNSTVSFRINIDNESTTWDNSEPTWLKDGEQTLISAIKSTSTYVEPENLGVTANTTVPGVRESLETEAIISSIEDDYGTSYYYRGNIENNYVNYSGMCWRIVRIQGDGTIKLALADEDYECNESGALANELTAFITDPTYDQFQYSMGDSAPYIDIFKWYYSPDNLGNMLRIALDSWLNGGNAAYDSLHGEFLTFDKIADTSKIVETEWCHNEAVVAKIDSKVMFDSYYRLSNEDENLRIPKLKCNTKGDMGPSNEYDDNGYPIGEIPTNSVKVSNTIGTLTADEFALAGSIYQDYWTTPTHYLMDNATGLGMLTMSPAYIHTSNNFSAIIGTVDANYSDKTKIGAMMSIKIQDKGAIRPVIALRSDVVLDTNISGQNGTSTNPFEIK